MANPFETPEKPAADDKGIAPTGKLSDEARESLMTTLSLTQQRHDNQRAGANAVDLVGEAGYTALYQGLQAPVKSLGQIADKALNSANIKTNIADAVDVMPAPEHEKFGTARWHAQQIGGGLGMIAPFVATKGLLAKSGLSFAAKTEAGVLASSRLMSVANAGLIADGAAAGFAYDFLLRPVEQQDMNKFWETRTKHGITGAATFGTLTAGSVGLRHLTRPLAGAIAEAPGAVKVANDVLHGALPGVPAGLVNADVNARLTQGRWATNQERFEGMYTMTFAGGALGGMHRIPGSEVPLSEIAKAYSSRRAGQTNLESMLAERAKTTTTDGKAPSTTGDGAPVKGSLLGGPRESGSSSRRLVGGLALGRAMASGDKVEGWTPEIPPERVTPGEKPPAEVKAEAEVVVPPKETAGVAKETEGVAKPVETEAVAKPTETDSAGKPVDAPEKVAAPVETEISVPKGLEQALEKGVNLAFEASDANCTPAQVKQFFEFARSPEGQALKESMSQVAKSYADDPRMMTLIREAYLPPEGVEHRVIEGDIKLKTPGATVDQYQRWAQFMQTVREMPQDVDGYINFRHDVFRWLNENKDLHDWARQYGEQNRYSKIAGPLDYYFGTSNLSRFVDVADGKIAANVGPKAAESSSVVNEGGAVQPRIRLDLTPEQAREGAVVNQFNDGLARLGNLDVNGIASGVKPFVETEGVAGRTPESERTRLQLETPEAARIASAENPAKVMEQRMEAFEKSPASRKKIEAMLLSEKFGDMTTEQFAKWLDYAYAKPEGATSNSATNLRSLWVGGRDALLSPQVAEAYRQYRFGETTPEGATPPPSLEAIRQFLSAPKTGETPEFSEWARFYVDARLEQAKGSAGPEAQPHQVLDAALPRWYVEGLKGQYVTDAKFAGDAPTYSSKLPVELAEAMEAARQTQPPKRPRSDGKPEREFKPPTNDAGFRLTKLEELMQVQDPIIRDNLLRLGAQDQTVLRNILQKLDPERAAPEYRELLQNVLPTTKNIGDVKILLDAIFFGNKNHRTDNGSQLTKAHQQLAMAVAENLVPQGNPHFERTQQIVNDMIAGKIRDPRPPRDFGDGGGRNFGGKDGGKDGGRDGGRGGRDGGRDSRGENRDVPKPEGDKTVAHQTGSRTAKVLAEPPRPPETVVAAQPKVVKPVETTSAKPPEVEQVVPADIIPESQKGPSVVSETVVTPEQAQPAERLSAASERPATELERPGTETDRSATELQRTATEKEVSSQTSRDISSLKHGQKVKVDGKDAIFIAADAGTGEAIVRSGKPTQPKEQFYNAKLFDKLKLQEIGRDSGTNRTIYRDGDGKFYEVRVHGSGYMTALRTEYRAVKPSDVK